MAGLALLHFAHYDHASRIDSSRATRSRALSPRARPDPSGGRHRLVSTSARAHERKYATRISPETTYVDSPFRSAWGCRPSPGNGRRNELQVRYLLRFVGLGLNAYAPHRNQPRLTPATSRPNPRTFVGFHEIRIHDCDQGILARNGAYALLRTKRTVAESAR